MSRTIRRTPEVMVKVLPTSANTLKAVRKHLAYIGRKGELDLETADGDRLRNAKDLAEDWDLDLDEHRSKLNLTATRGKEPARLVHKVIFSMPAGTPPGKVLEAVRNFAREEFALNHRYALTLHTDEPHPHVHVVIKAMSERGQRLHVRKATLREWREGFAHHLRLQGVPANATRRFDRGETCPRKRDGIYRAALRGDSTHIHLRLEAVVQELRGGKLRLERGKTKLLATRREMQLAWSSVNEILLRSNQPMLAAEVRRFAENMPPAATEKEWTAARLVQRIYDQRLPESPSR